MGCRQWAIGVGWYEVVCGEWVIGAFALSAYPAGDGGVTDLFGLAFVVAFVVRSVRFRVRPVPCGLAGVAAWCVGCQGAAS